MIRCVPFNSPLHARYTKAVIKVDFSEEMKGIIAEDKLGLPCGVVLFEAWTTNSVTCHIGITKQICLRRLLPESFYYAFETADRRIMWGSCPSDNEAAIRLNKHLGFEIYHVIEDYYRDGVASVIFRMKKEDCRFLPKKRIEEAA